MLGFLMCLCILFTLKRSKNQSPLSCLQEMWLQSGTWVFLPALLGHPLVLCQAAHLSHLRGHGEGVQALIQNILSSHQAEVAPAQLQGSGCWSDTSFYTTAFVYLR